jgi:hypothetical protein
MCDFPSLTVLALEIAVLSNTQTNNMIMIMDVNIIKSIFRRLHDVIFAINLEGEATTRAMLKFCC